MITGNTEESEEEALKLCSTATHEASHAIATLVLTGQPATISIERKTSAAGDVWFDGVCVHPATDPAAQRRISLAGAIGQALFHDRHSTGSALRNAVWNMMSGADRQNAGPFSLQDAEDALQLVRANWAAIETRAALEVAKFLGTAPAPASHALPVPVASKPKGSDLARAASATERLRVMKADALRSAHVLIDMVAAEGREFFTAEEQRRFRAHVADIEGINVELDDLYAQL